MVESKDGLLCCQPSFYWADDAVSFLGWLRPWTLESGRTGLESCLCQLLAVWPWTILLKLFHHLN